MKGVAIPSVSPGSSQREASVMWTPQVMVPAGASAADAAAPKPRTIATKAMTMREVHDLMGSSQWRISRKLLTGHRDVVVDSSDDYGRSRVGNGRRIVPRVRRAYAFAGRRRRSTDRADPPAQS